MVNLGETVIAKLHAIRNSQRKSLFAILLCIIRCVLRVHSVVSFVTLHFGNVIKHELDYRTPNEPVRMTINLTTMSFRKTYILFLSVWFLSTRGSFAQVSQTEGLKKINGTSLYLKTIGQGEPILIVHGGPGMNHSYFIPHLDKLAKKYKIVFYDQRASGKSSIPSPDSISLKFFADDIEAIRRELGVEKLNLLAHSWGAIPAVNYAMYYPAKVGRMILVNPVPLSREFDQEMLENQRKKVSEGDSTDRSIILGSKDFKSGNPDAYKKLLMLSFRHSFYKTTNHSKLKLDMPANYLTASQALYAGLGKDLGQYDFYEAVKSFSFPLLIIHGDSDAIPLEASSKMQRAVPGSTLVVFKKCGHFAFIEKAGRFRTAVSTFLKK